MAFNAVKSHQYADFQNSAAPLAADTAPARTRYDLATAIGVVRQMETSAGRAAVFEEIKAKNPLYRLVDGIYAWAGKDVQPLALFAYMLKCAVSVGPEGTPDAEAVAISSFPNEHRTLDRVAALAPDMDLLRLTTERRNVAAFGQARSALALVKAGPRIMGFLRTLAATHSFMPAARIASALAYYIRFSQLLAERPSIKAAIVASNYSPEAVGLAAAAHAAGRKVIYANHAPVPANGAVVPPVYADCALFYGDVIAETYRRRSACTAEVGTIGQPGSSLPMAWRERIETVGIFLTSGTKVETLKSLIATIRLERPDVRILIRQHPVTLLKTDFKGIGVDDPLVELTIGQPLDEEIAACDLVICGNSGVAMNVLSGGRPVAYLSSLDGIAFDANGFVQSRLVMSVPWWTDDIYDRLKGFYQAPGWEGVMRRYDASYGVDPAELRAAASRLLLRHVRPGLREEAVDDAGSPDSMSASA